MEEENYYFVVGKNYLSDLDKLYVNDVFDVRDRLNKRLIYSKINYDENNKDSEIKFFIESNFLKVIGIDETKKKITLDLDQSTNDLFEHLDDNCLDLLDKVLNDDESKHNIEISGALNYTTIVKDKQMKLFIDSDTVITFENKSITLDQIKPNDMLRFLIGVESINLYPNELNSYIRTYCHMIEIHRSNLGNLTKRKNIKNYKFSTDVNNIFQKVILEDQDISIARTEIENDKSDKSDKSDHDVHNLDSESIESDKPEHNLESDKPEHNLESDKPEHNLESDKPEPIESDKPEPIESDKPEPIESKSDIEAKSDTETSNNFDKENNKPKRKYKQRESKKNVVSTSKKNIDSNVTKGKPGRKKKINTE